MKISQVSSHGVASIKTCGFSTTSHHNQIRLTKKTDNQKRLRHNVINAKQSTILLQSNRRQFPV